MYLNQVILVNPNGNITALVYDNIDRSDYIQISNFIMRVFPEVEQVGFIKNASDNKIRLEMMGMELCVNALLALAFLINKPGEERKIETTGLEGDILTKKKDSSICEVEFANKDLDIKLISTPENYLIDMSGISHLLIDSVNFIDNRIQEYLATIRKYVNKSALGANSIKYDPSNELFYINPFVFVEGVNTLTNEKSCASGSIAVAYLNKLSTKRTKTKIMQPSGSQIEVEFKQDSVCLSGKVEYIKMSKLSFNVTIDATKP